MNKIQTYKKESSASIKSDTIFFWRKPIKQINVVNQKKTKKKKKSQTRQKQKRTHSYSGLKENHYINIVDNIDKMQNLVGKHK